MAIDGRQSRPDLAAPPAAPQDLDFFELLRRLEAAEGKRFGHGSRPGQEPARLGQTARLGFATRDVTALHPATATRPARVTVALFGLTGPEGPLPLHLTRWLLDRLGQRWYAADPDTATSDTTFLDLLNLIQHRMIAFFYRAWADQRPEVQMERPGAGRLGAMIEALAGPGNPSLAGPRAAQVTALAHQIRGPERVTALVTAVTGAPVTITEFAGAWTTLPARLSSRLGRAHATLGQGATLGPRIFSRQNRIELRVGPLPFADYLAFLPGGPRRAALRLAVLETLGETLDVDMRLCLRGADVPRARLGASQLGRTAWIGGRGGEDAQDLRVTALVGLAPDGPRAAA